MTSEVHTLAFSWLDKSIIGSKPQWCHSCHGGNARLIVAGLLSTCRVRSASDNSKRSRSTDWNTNSGSSQSCTGECCTKSHLEWYNKIAWAKCVGSKKNISGILGLPRNKQAVSRPETEDTLHSRCSFYQNFTAVKSMQTNILSQHLAVKGLPTGIVNFFLTEINWTSCSQKQRTIKTWFKFTFVRDSSTYQVISIKCRNPTVWLPSCW